MRSTKRATFIISVDMHLWGTSGSSPGQRKTIQETKRELKRIKQGKHYGKAVQKKTCGN